MYVGMCVTDFFVADTCEDKGPEVCRNVCWLVCPCVSVCVFVGQVYVCVDK